MIEPLFRAKTINVGEWVEGFSIWKGFKDTVYILDENEKSAHRIDKATLTQYTGLNDKSGKKVFGGDIIKDKEGRIYWIVWNVKDAAFKVMCKEWTLSEYLNVIYPMEYYDVIGNIFDNQELIV